jgi:integration host factor subunit beta
MTKSQLIELLSARHSQLAPKDAELAVKTMLDAMAHTLASGNRIEIRGFGSFGLNYRPPRTGRNPKTGEKVQVPRKYVPHFKAGKELRERVDYHEGCCGKDPRRRRTPVRRFFWLARSSRCHGEHGFGRPAQRGALLE